MMSLGRSTENKLSQKEGERNGMQGEVRNERAVARKNEDNPTKTPRKQLIIMRSPGRST